jgi:HTH-type transcriptional repressor of NAD biosynthesis genes
MSRRFEKGLVVGKFCPLHHGHQFLIDEAIRQCARVFVVSYTKPEFENCGTANRDRWIAELFPSVDRLVIDDDVLGNLCRDLGIHRTHTVPDNDAPEEEHRQFVAWLCSTILATTIDAVFTSEDYGDGFADVLTRHFHKQADEAEYVRHVCVDREREAIPISGTAIRSDPYMYRCFLAPTVYATFVRRVAILGGESSGKTTLAQGLAARLSTAWVPEYGRELWEERNGLLKLDDMVKIGLEQIRRENNLVLEARRWLICDTTPLTTTFYSQEMFGEVVPELAHLATREYDYTIVCEPDFDFVQDGTRQTAAFRDKQHRWYLKRLRELGRSFAVASGPQEKRLANIVSLLRSEQHK